MTERELQTAVLELASLLGYRCHHQRPARTSNGWRTSVEGVGSQGHPDLLLLNAEQRRLIYAELKSTRGRLTVDQEAWLAELTRIQGAEVYVWRPSHWVSGEIEAVLRGQLQKQETAA